MPLYDPYGIAYNTSTATHGELPDRIYTKLRDLIIRGRLEPASRVVEAELARRFGVSRTPVREALAQLARGRYVVPAGNGRRTEFRVAPLDSAEVAELWGVIGALEGYAIQSVSRLGTENRRALVAELQQVNEALEVASNARPRDNDVWGELMSAFHERFMSYCAGPYLSTLYESVRHHVQRYEWAFGTITDAPLAPSIAEHRRIIAAVGAGDGSAARRAVEEHWANGLKRTRTLVARLTARQSRGTRLRLDT
jgi:DNA-binding GntR family transcriptional regulator